VYIVGCLAMIVASNYLDNETKEMNEEQIQVFKETYTP